MTKGREKKEVACLAREVKETSFTSRSTAVAGKKKIPKNKSQLKISFNYKIHRNPSELGNRKSLEKEKLNQDNIQETAIETEKMEFFLHQMEVSQRSVKTQFNSAICGFLFKP